MGKYTCTHEGVAVGRAYWVRGKSWAQLRGPGGVQATVRQSFPTYRTFYSYLAHEGIHRVFTAYMNRAQVEYYHHIHATRTAMLRCPICDAPITNGKQEILTSVVMSDHESCEACGLYEWDFQSGEGRERLGLVTISTSWRDVLAHAMVLMERAGLSVNLHCHDEAVASIQPTQFDLFMRLLTTCPVWRDEDAEIAANKAARIAAISEAQALCADPSAAGFLRAWRETGDHTPLAGLADWSEENDGIYPLNRNAIKELLKCA